MRIILYIEFDNVDCDRAREILVKRGIHHFEINLDQFPECRSEMNQLVVWKDLENPPALPQIFFGLDHIGSLQELEQLAQTDALEKRVEMMKRVQTSNFPTVPDVSNPTFHLFERYVLDVDWLFLGVGTCSISGAGNNVSIS